MPTLDEDHRYYVYAVELSPAAAQRHADRALVRRGARVYYVGHTAHTTANRLANHLWGGHTSNGAVHRHARGVVGHVGPFRSRDEAERQERRWARRIRRLGHVVIGGH